MCPNSSFSVIFQNDAIVICLYFTGVVFSCKSSHSSNLQRYLINEEETSSITILLFRLKSEKIVSIPQRSGRNPYELLVVDTNFSKQSSLFSKTSCQAFTTSSTDCMILKWFIHDYNWVGSYSKACIE